MLVFVTGPSSLTDCILHFITEEELGSSEESGKDWSDLEREAAEEDKDRKDFQDEYADSKNKKGPPERSSHRSPDKKSKHGDKDRYVDVYQILTYMVLHLFCNMWISSF